MFLDITELAPDTELHARVVGAVPGQLVSIVAGAPGGGTCLGTDLCVDLVAPQVLGTVVADESGAATLTLHPSSTLPVGVDLVLQAVAGARGAEQVSDARAATVRQAPHPAHDVHALLAAAWTGAAPLLDPLQEHSVVALRGEVVVIGGLDTSGTPVDRVEAYDPVDDVWRSLAPLPRRLHHVNAAVVGDRLYVLGGLNPSFQAVGTAFVYNPTTDVWSTRTGVPARRAVGSAVVGVLDGRIHLVGGLRGGQSVRLHTAWDPVTGASEVLAPATQRRDHATGGVVGGELVVVGGRTDSITAVRSRLEIYGEALDQWTLGAPMPTARGGAAGAVAPDGRLHVVGGEGNPGDPSGVFDDHEAWNPTTDQWEILDPMLTPRHGMGAVWVGDTMWVPGGGVQQILGPTDVLEGWTSGP